MNNYVQYIIIRKDLIETMGVGKTAAQVAHASVGSVILDGKIIESEEIKGWLNGTFTKVVLYVKSKQKLLNIMKKCEDENIFYKPIYDSCRTKLTPEEKDGTTLTCIGISPLNILNVPKFLTKLRLLDGY